MWSADTFRKRAKGDKKAKKERARLGDYGVAGVSSKRDLYEARATLITATVEDGIQQKVTELWTHDKPVRPARAGYFRPSWLAHCAEMAKLSFRVRTRPEASSVGTETSSSSRSVGGPKTCQSPTPY
jgi:hypothetical protein